MTALFVSYSGLFGGAERLLVDYARDLEIECCLACPEGALADRARAAGLPVLAVPARPLELRGGWRSGLTAAWHLSAHAADVQHLTRALQPDLVVGWNMRSAVACAAALSGRTRRPRLVFQHNDLLPSGVVGRLVRFAADRADRVVCLSGAIAADLDSRWQEKDHVRVALPGVDLQRWACPPAPAGPPNVLVLGAIVDWKRPDMALEAVARARISLPELALTVAGQPLGRRGWDLLQRLERRAQSPDLAGHVRFTGGVADPEPVVASAACLLHCADEEPLGMVVLEAMAAGRPVIAPAAGGPLELLDHEVGRLYEPGDAAGAALALVDVLGEPGHAAALGAKARRRAQAHFGREVAQKRWQRAVGLPAERVGNGNAPRAGAAALVVVTHNSATELGVLLRSARRHLEGWRVVVADSGSVDDSAEVARSFSDGQVIEIGENVGFGRACNRALQEVTEPVAVLLNPDVELIDASLTRLVEDLRMHGSPERILAPLVLHRSGRLEDSVHPSPLSCADLIRSALPPAALPGRLGVALAPWRSRRARRVGWAVGCCLVARTETLRRLGPFDERIFLYGEDMDLGLRAVDAGVETWFRPDARIVHERAHASNRVFGGEPLERLARQRRLVIARRRGLGHAMADDAAQLLTFASRLALKRALRRPAERERRQLDALLRVRREPLPPADQPQGRADS